MSGFSSLGGKSHQEQDQQQAESNNFSLFLTKNEEIYNKGFELWQQNYQFQQQKPQSQSQSQHNMQQMDFLIGPSNDIDHELSNYNSYRSARLGFQVMNQLGRSGNDDGLSCQDCGNQAKKDCVHMRCRTCCKGRGFPCSTHVKSTWVPAAKRRERQQQDQRQLTVGGENPKRPRDGGGSSGGFELGHFPAELNSPAVFRCVRVSAVDDGDEQLAYQTAVNIGGHVFKGILYDQGPESQFPGAGGGGGPTRCQQQPPLDHTAGGGAGATTIAASSSNLNAMMLDPSVYSPQLNGFMAGTHFFLPPRN